jgi:hypothetical protein
MGETQSWLVGFYVFLLGMGESPAGYKKYRKLLRLAIVLVS